MTPMNVAVTIWWKAVLINAALISLGSIFLTGILFVAVFIIVLILGFIVTLPLLPLIGLLVRFHTMLPYGNAARISWLRFMLVLVVCIIYGGFTIVTEDSLSSPEPVVLLIGSATCIAVVSAVAFSRKIITQLSDETPFASNIN